MKHIKRIVVMGLFQREENSARRLRVVHVAEHRRHVTALHAAVFDLHDDFAPLILGLVEIQQVVHTAIRAGWQAISFPDSFPVDSCIGTG